MLMRAISTEAAPRPEDDEEMPPEPTAAFEKSVSFASQTYDIVIRRWGDKKHPAMPSYDPSLLLVYVTVSSSDESSGQAVPLEGSLSAFELSPENVRGPSTY